MANYEHNDLPKKRKYNNIKAKKYSFSVEKPLNIRITNKIITLNHGRGCKPKINKYEIFTKGPRERHSKLQIMNLEHAHEVMNTACAYSCGPSTLDQNDVQGFREYNIAQKKNVFFLYTGTEVNRLLTFTQTISKDMQTLLQNLKADTFGNLENSSLESFTLALNLDIIQDYFDFHDKLDYESKIPGHGLLRKVEVIKEMAMLPVGTTSSIFSISIERQCSMIIISIYKWSSLRERFLNTLATMSGNQEPDSMKNPALLLQNWHFHNIAQGYLLKHLFDSFNIVALNTMRKLYFVLITSPYPYLDILISFRCSRNGMFTALDPKPSSKLFCELLNWSKDHQAKWMAYVYPDLVTRSSRQQARNLHIKNSISDTLSNRPVLRKEDDQAEGLNTIYNTELYSDSDSIYAHFCESDKLIGESKSVPTVCDLSNNESSQETVVFNSKTATYDFVSSKTTRDKTCSLHFLTSKMWVKCPKIFSDQKDSGFKHFTSEKIISEFKALNNEFWNHINSQEFYVVFLKTFGKLFVSTVISTLI